MQTFRFQKLNQVSLSILVVLLCLLNPIPVFAVGLDFGGGSSGGDDSVCSPDTNLVITPGPIASPVRITAFDSETFLVADYTRDWVYKVGLDGNPVRFFATAGHPLSIAVRPGRRTVLYVGNDSTKTLDLYTLRRGKLRFKKQLFRREGIQALDMVFDPSLSQLFIVDGLAREIKVLDRRGRLKRSFGGEMVLASPKGIAVDATSGEVFVSDYGDPAVGIPASIKVFDLSGNLNRSITGNFSRPQGVSLTQDKLFVADNVLAQILEFDRDSGVKVGSYGCQGSSEGHLLLPMDVALGPQGLQLYVADNRNMRVTTLPLSGAN
jgi:DNA-binding beta-propeller fold protein YncE